MNNADLHQLGDVYEAAVFYPHELTMNTNRGMEESVESEDRSLLFHTSEKYTKGKCISSTAP